MRRVILLTGPARAGKDSVANILERLAPFQRLALADPIRAMLKAGGLITDADLKYKEETIHWLGQSARRLMQTLGTEWGRDLVHSEIWIRLLVRKVKALPPEARAVVTDVRFENEVEVLTRELGGEVWHVSRPGIAPVSAHTSEAGVQLRRDHVRINNSGSLADLENAVALAYARP